VLPPISDWEARSFKFSYATPPVGDFGYPTKYSPPSVGLAASASPHAGAVLMQDWYFSGAAPIFFHMPLTFEFCLPAVGTTVPASPEWLHEIKFDGYRLRVVRNGDCVNYFFSIQRLSSEAGMMRRTG
jgi:hypothetical protein